MSDLEKLNELIDLIKDLSPETQERLISTLIIFFEIKIKQPVDSEGDRYE